MICCKAWKKRTFNRLLGWHPLKYNKKKTLRTSTGTGREHREEKGEKKIFWKRWKRGLTYKLAYATIMSSKGERLTKPTRKTDRREVMANDIDRGSWTPYIVSRCHFRSYRSNKEMTAPWRKRPIFNIETVVEPWPDREVKALLTLGSHQLPGGS